MSDTPLSPRAGEPFAPIPASWAAILERTPARVFRGRAGPAYSSEVQLELRRDHAFALDAVHAELDLARDFPPSLIDDFALFEVSTRARNKQEYLHRPDLGRRFDERAASRILAACPPAATLQVVLGDGLSAPATIRQTPNLLPALRGAAQERGWTFGLPFVVRHCRVGILNEIGELLRPEVVVLLLGERPGLVTSESLSAYLAYRPRFGHTDAQRNLVSNIHDRGVSIEEAVRRVVSLADEMIRRGTSGTAIKES